ncbi:MAG: DUF5615 family PIN-like protein [Chloroflexi bacterium]|nr:DUF5615 family PIN-like protein [Chloroflexota bacterium]
MTGLYPAHDDFTGQLCATPLFAIDSGMGYAATLLSSHIASDSADIDVIALATKLDAALLTVDLDFANILDYPPKQYAGIIVLRYAVQEETILDTTLKSALDDMYRDDLRNKLVIISAGNYRVRR